MVTGVAGRSVVVTGATSGIGKAVALALAQAGFTVFGTARSEEKAAALREDAAKAGTSLRTVTCDVADADQTAEAFGKVAAATGGGPWAVVNNAGYAQIGTVEDVPEDWGRQQLEVNLLAPVRIAKLVLPLMRERGDGRIVNVSSSSGRISYPGFGWYCASKFALRGISDVLRMEVAEFGVRVILVEPGGFATGIWQRGAASLPPLDGSPYARRYGIADGILAYARGLPGPEPVARTVCAALTSPRPRARYMVGGDVKIGTVLETLLPASATDYVKSIRYGLRTPSSPAERLGASLISQFLTARSAKDRRAR